MVIAEPRVLTVEEAADLLRIGRTTVYDLIRTGQLDSGSAGSPASAHISSPRRPDFPRPVADLQAGKVWRAEDIEAWIKARRPHQDDLAG